MAKKYKDKEPKLTKTQLILQKYGRDPFKKTKITTAAAARPVKISKAQQRILDKYANIRESINAPDYKGYGKGSGVKTGPSTWNKQVTAIGALAEGYKLTRAERNSAVGLARRLNNIMKLVQKDSKIEKLMEHRWQTSDMFEKFGYINFKDLKQADIARLVEVYVAESGILQLPSLTSPEGGTTANQWDS